jgi:alpha/beta superfamily hydrolase
MDNNTNISKQLFIAGKAGRLEAIFNPKPEPAFLAVVCHPNPWHGGTMHHKVPFNTARTLGECGAATLRFNFRGVMASDGKYDHGIGEEQDVLSALDFLTSQYPDVKNICIAGFSFGGWVGLKVGVQDERVQTLIALGMRNMALDDVLLQTSYKKKLFIYGDADELNPIEILNAKLSLVADPKEIHFIPTADHYFSEHLPAMNELVKSFVMREILEA